MPDAPKKTAAEAAVLVHRLKRPKASRHWADGRGLRALLALLHFELDALAFGQALEARAALDLAEVSEQILAAAFRRDEAEALAIVEPLDGAGFE